MTARSLRQFALCLALSQALSVPALAQRLGQDSDEGVPAVRVILALILCLALAAAAAFALRARLGGGALRWTAGRAERRLELRDSLRLPHQVDLSIVRCDGREMLIVASQHGVQVFDHSPSDDISTDDGLTS